MTFFNWIMSRYRRKYLGRVQFWKPQTVEFPYVHPASLCRIIWHKWHFVGGPHPHAHLWQCDALYLIDTFWDLGSGGTWRPRAGFGILNFGMRDAETRALFKRWPRMRSLSIGVGGLRGLNIYISYMAYMAGSSHLAPQYSIENFHWDPQAPFSLFFEFFSRAKSHEDALQADFRTQIAHLQWQFA